MLEEIVGNIRDESDTESGPIYEQNEHAIVVDAALPMRELQAETGWTFDGRPRETVGNWISRKCGCALNPGKPVTIDGFLVSALATPLGAPERVRVERVTPLPAPA